MKQTFLSFLLMLLPMMASAETVEINGIYYDLVKKLKTAEVVKTPIYDNWSTYSGEIVIPSTVTYEGVECSVKSIANKAFYKCSKLKSVTIPNSVTSIGEFAFSGCIKLPSVVIPNGVTSIGYSAFSGCSGLTSVTIPNSVTSIGGSAFSGCSGVTSVTIPNSVNSIGSEPFYGCSGLESIKVEDENIIYDSRNSCNAIIKTSENELIQGCKNTTIPNSVTYICRCAFANCNDLTSLTIPSSIKAIGEYAFSGCSGLTSLTIPNGVVSIENNAFAKCGNLTTVTIPKSVTNIDWEVFANCDDLTDVYCMGEKLKEWNGEGLYVSADAFKNSYPQAMTLHVPVSAIEAYKNTAPWSSFNSVVAIGEGEIPETPKCAMPTIKYENGEIEFSCATEGVEYVSNIKTSDSKNYYEGRITLSNKYTVTVYATKTGYDNSDTATLEIVGSAGCWGDLNGDGAVNVADHVELTKIILNQQ